MIINQILISMIMQSLVWAVKSVKFWRAHLVDQLNLTQSSKIVICIIYI